MVFRATIGALMPDGVSLAPVPGTIAELMPQTRGLVFGSVLTISPIHYYLRHSSICEMSPSRGPISRNFSAKCRLDSHFNAFQEHNRTMRCAAIAIALSILSVPADAKGCIKGAVVGGLAGHLVPLSHKPESVGRM
jgi:hypothetical protein